MNALTKNPPEALDQQLHTRLFQSHGKWVLEFKTPTMPMPAYWHYFSEEDARDAERRLNPEKYL